MVLLLVIPQILVVIVVKGSGLPRRLVHSGSRSWPLNAEEVEKIAPSFLRRRGGRGGRASQSFSSPWGWVKFALGKPGTFGGNRLRGFSGLSVEPKGPVHWQWSILISCMHALTWSDTSSLFTVRTTTTTRLRQVARTLLFSVLHNDV